MNPINPQQINAAVTRALKLDGQRVTKIVLTFEVAKLPTVEITRYGDNADADGLTTLVEMLQLQAMPAEAPKS